MSVDPDIPIEPQKSKDKWSYRWSRWVLKATGLLVLLVAIIFALRPTAISSPTNIENAPTLSISGIVERPNPHIGPLDAPVTIVEFSDFACPACSVWNESGVLEKVFEKYRDKVRFVWADFPSVTLESQKAAEAGRCAYDQDKFWEYHDYLFAHIEALGENDLKVYASFLGLDRAQFDQCLDSGARKEEVMIDYRDALVRKVGVLPTFYVNETRLVGPPSFELLVSVIDPILANAP